MSASCQHDDIAAACTVAEPSSARKPSVMLEAGHRRRQELWAAVGSIIIHHQLLSGPPHGARWLAGPTPLCHHRHCFTARSPLSLLAPRAADLSCVLRYGAVSRINHPPSMPMNTMRARFDPKCHASLTTTRCFADPPIPELPPQLQLGVSSTSHGAAHGVALPPLEPPAIATTLCH